MTDPREPVEVFIAAWGEGFDAFATAVEEYFTDDTVWENVGYSTTVGPTQALDHLRESATRLGWVRVRVEMLALAVDGSRVLTERVDHHETADGQVSFSVRCASVFDVEGGRIGAIREYFDTAPLEAARAAGGAVAGAG